MITYADFLALPEPNAAHLLEAYELDSERTEESLDLFLLETLLAETRACRDDEGSWQVMLRKLPQSVYELLLSKITVPPGRISIRTAPDADAEFGYPQYLVHRCELAHPERPAGQQDPRCACLPAGDERVYLLRTPVVADSYTLGANRTTWARLRPMMIDPRPEPKDIPLAEYHALAYARMWIRANDPLLLEFLAGEANP